MKSFCNTLTNVWNKYLLHLLILQAMKQLKHILLRLIFLLAILFCMGLEVYSHYSAKVCNTELAAQQEVQDNIALQNGDFAEDETVSLRADLNYFEEPLVLLPTDNKLFLLKQYSFLNWQPPKFL